LRKQDLISERGGWLLRIEPKPSPRNGRAGRSLALHPHLIELGLVEFFRGNPRETLFCDVPADGSESPWERPSADLAKWFRKLGVTDPSVQATTGWRAVLQLKGHRRA
jgi:hypothetical protein